MKKITGILLAGAIATGVHFYINNSVVANTSSDINRIISLPNGKNIEFWLAKVKEDFPDTRYNGELMFAMTTAEDFIQELDSPMREKGMELIEKQFKEVKNPAIQKLQENLNNLTTEEKNKLNELLFAESQRRFAELLLFLSENSPKASKQCEKPKLLI